MKNFLLLLFPTFLLAASSLSAQGDCQAFFPFEEKTEMEYTSYDAKGKVSSTALHKVTVVDHVGEGVIEAQIETELFDKKGDKSTDGKYQVRCDGNTLHMNLADLMPPGAMEGFASMEVTIEGDPMLTPHNLKEGQTLPDATNVISAGTEGGLTLFNATVTATDRKVLGKETIDTPLGQLSCWKISHTTSVKMLVRRTMDVVTWYHEDMGLVKQETFNKKGKSDGTMVLTKFKKG